MKNEINWVSSSIRSLESQISSQKREIENLESEANSLNNEAKEKKQKLSALVSEQDQLNRSIQELSQKESDLTTEKNRVKQKLSSSLETISNIKNSIAQIESHITDLTNTAKGLVGNLTTGIGEAGWKKQEGSVSSGLKGSVASHNKKSGEIGDASKIDEGFESTNIDIGKILKKTDLDFEKYLVRGSGPITPKEGQAIVDFANKKFVGNETLRYSDDPKERGGPKAYDCSGFVHAVYEKMGMPYGTKRIPIPRVQDIVDDTERWKEISIDEARPGDLVIHLQGEGYKKIAKSNHIGILSKRKDNGDVIEISAQIRGGLARLDPTSPHYENPINASPSDYFGDKFRILRRIKI
ncbi:MAG: C40 family peptidase [Oligoflexia bacterium]|nr:C40 family peptidase [Oligoflexia bacterium]